MKRGEHDSPGLTFAARQARNATVLLGIEPDFDQFPSLMRSGRPFPFINRVLCRLCQHRMSALDVDELDRAMPFPVPDEFLDGPVSGVA
jgi:hypothetical protein